MVGCIFLPRSPEIQGAFALVLTHRHNGHGSAARGTLRSLVDRARKVGILPTLVPGSAAISDPIEALIALRNGLSHGASDIHSPGMALNVVVTCASWIDQVFPMRP